MNSKIDPRELAGLLGVFAEKGFLSESECPLEPIEQCGKPYWNSQCQYCGALRQFLSNLARYDDIFTALAPDLAEMIDDKAKEKLAPEIRQEIAEELSLKTIAECLAGTLEKLQIDTGMSNEEKGIVLAAQILSVSLRDEGVDRETILHTALQEATRSLSVKLTETSS